MNGGLRGRAFPRRNASLHSRLLSSCGRCGTRLNYVSGKAGYRLSGVSDEGERCRKQKQGRERGCALCDSQYHHETLLKTILSLRRFWPHRLVSRCGFATL
jgi:hypothetical protein